MTKGHSLRTWIEIDTHAAAHNVGQFRKVIGKSTQLCAVAKSNAYGHCLVEMARFFEKNKVDWIAVDSIVEAVRLREEGIVTPLLVLGATLIENYGLAEKHAISLAVSTREGIRALRGRNIAVHIKIDTGMHRQGFQVHEMEALCTALKQNKVHVEGVFTHFASAKNPSFPQDMNQQIEKFELARAVLKKAGFSPMCHAGATGGALLCAKARYDMVRIGIGMYGLWPSEETERAMSHVISLKPVMTWKAVICEVKKVKKGERVGYDCTEELVRNSTLAVVPIGYWHGYPRALSSVGRVSVRGGEGRVVGRVSMDMIVVDVTNVKRVRAGDEVVLLGGTKNTSAYEVARLAGTSHYEIVTRINPLIERVLK